ncbi:MAG: hypothetical protein LBS83_03020 [Holosporales bacterium]|jgi:hypothetical protein|nr:hypothetical protein [Holosporales bacterium]
MQIRQIFLLLGLVCSFSSLPIHGDSNEQSIFAKLARQFETPLEVIQHSLQYVSNTASETIEKLYPQPPSPPLSLSDPELKEMLRGAGDYFVQKIFQNAFSKTIKHCFARVLEIPIKSFNFFYNGAPKISERSLLGFIPWVSGEYDEGTISLPKRMIFSATTPLTLLVFNICRLSLISFRQKQDLKDEKSLEEQKQDLKDRIQYFAKSAGVNAAMEAVKLPSFIKCILSEYIFPYISLEKLKKLLPFKGKLLPLRI